MDQLVSLSKIFSEKIYRIPDYQRGYAWTKKEVEEFWSDLYRLDEKKNHYVGVLTLEPVDTSIFNNWIDDTWIIESKRYIPYYVVDGQQRLTTSIILITAILEVMKANKIEKLNFTKHEDIIKKYIYESKDDTDSLTYLFGYERENPSYVYLLANIFKYQKTISGKIIETTYTKNLIGAKEVFIEKLSKLNISELEAIYTKITQNFLFNVYTISKDIDVHVTFETMNNRGKPLSHLELLKNRLIYLSTLFDCGEAQKKILRREINSCWKEIYHLLGRITSEQIQDDEFLINHFMLYFSETIKNLEEEERFLFRYFLGKTQTNYLLNTHFVPKNIIDNVLKTTDFHEYIRSLNECIKLWDELKNPQSADKPEEIKEYLQKIRFLTRQSSNYHYVSFEEVPNRSYINVFILACFQACNSDNDLLLKFLKSLEKYLFVILFYDREAIKEESDIHLIDYFDSVLKLNKKELTVNEIIERMSKLHNTITSSPNIKNKTIRNYNLRGLYKNPWIKYFLCEYEYKLMKSSKSNLVKLDREILFSNGYNSIEHIYPLNSHYKYWTDRFAQFTSKQRNSLKHSLGNLVAISENKNSRLGNKPFPEKVSNTQNTTGYKFGTYAEIELTDFEEWGPDEILKRGLTLIAFLNERWDVKIAKKDDKKIFLGLNFL
ncbi:DUF262 domain-containing protein [Proteiniclasticum ruminis]|uniref:DUF262 domain-containing protein n=1 Tax=Proteiniclasticum ruminis TaxID=398199 RepID=A0A1G8RS39_9CLOT|nr:DUF262 domain-containing protein [Proteiniclasticum ruminis]SDJ19884.1 Protein of unknown function [Proteiniclasticum ruminis]